MAGRGQQPGHIYILSNLYYWPAEHNEQEHGHGQGICHGAPAASCGELSGQPAVRGRRASRAHLKWAWTTANRSNSNACSRDSCPPSQPPPLCETAVAGSLAAARGCPRPIPPHRSSMVSAKKSAMDVARGKHVRGYRATDTAAMKEVAATAVVQLALFAGRGAAVLPGLVFVPVAALVFVRWAAVPGH